MKKIFYIAILMVVTVACNTKEKKTEVVAEETEAVKEVVRVGTYKGEFIHVADAAVLKVDNIMYAVEINALSEALATKVAPVKKDDYDMVPVTVKGTLGSNPMFKETGEGWEQMLTITEIVEVGTVPAQADIKIGKEKK